MNLSGHGWGRKVLSTTTLSGNTWYYVVGTWDGTTASIYVNGSVTTATNSNSIISSHTISVHIGQNFNYYFNGYEDEVRISNTAHTAGWITTEYNHQNSPSTFSSVGASEKYWYDASYLYRKQITIDHTKVSGGSNLTNFPVLISESSDADLKNGGGGYVQNSNGYDIVFVASDL